MSLQPSHPPADPFDPRYLRPILTEVFEPAFRHYFRPRLLGAHKLPLEGPIILAPNHSGSAFPYDAMVLDGILWARDGFRPERKFRSVFEKELSATWWMRPFGVDNFWRRCGGVDMTFDNYSRLLERGDRVIHYPEGVPGIGKGFRRRYQLQRYSSSVVVMAARHQAPVFPVHIVNAEWVIPFNVMLPWLDRLVQRLFRVPFLPLPGAFLAILFPCFWYLSLPARMIFRIGEPIDVAARVRAAGITCLDNADRAVLRRIAEEVRLEAQADLDRQVARYGRWPYQGRSLRREMRRARGKLSSAVLPTAWPALFVRYDRDQQRPTARHRLHRLLRDWDLIGFYLPFGWLLLSLCRRLRKPPYGFRGLSAKARRRREGNYTWHLRERPLPPRESPSA